MSQAAPAPSPGTDDTIIDVNERITWYQSPIDKALMKELIQRSDWQGFRQVGLHLGMIACTGSFIWYAWNHMAWPWVIVAMFLHGTIYGFFGGGVAGHELSHRTVFKTRWLNDFFAWMTSIMGWGNHVYFRASHVKHHQYTVHDDLDMEVTLPSQLTWAGWLFAFSCNPRGIWWNLKVNFRRARGIREGEWEHRIFPDSKPELLAEVTLVARVVLAVQFGLAALFVATGFWEGLLIFTFAPFYFGWLQLLMGFPQHAGMQGDVPDFRLCCRTFVANPLFNFLYWQMNYHVEHHMYAAVPFYNLKRLRRAIEADLPVAHTSLWATWREILTALKRQKTDPTYCCIPDLPGRPAAADRPGLPATSSPVSANLEDAIADA